LKRASKRVECAKGVRGGWEAKGGNGRALWRERKEEKGGRSQVKKVGMKNHSMTMTR